MHNTKKLSAGLLLFCLLSFAAMGQAADKGKDAKVQPPVPIVIEGDELYFSDLTGNMFAKGKVVVTQGPSSMLGDVVRGNAKTNELWIDDKATYLEPGNKLTGSAFHYNYKDHTGSMLKGSGNMGRELVSGEHVDFLPTGYIIYDGTMTACPAQVPDYHVSASKVEIWPGDKLVAYNAKFWIKDKLIYTIPKYQKSLRRDAQSDFPRVGYTSQDGFFISQYLEYPFHNTADSSVGAYVDLAYYGKRGFRPIVGLFDRESKYSMNLVQGHFRDGNEYWVKKEPEFRFDWHPQKIGNLPVSYNFYAIYGKWTDSAKSSWHQDYGLYFSGDPIKFSNFLQLNLGTGFERVRDRYVAGQTGNSDSNIFRWDATLYQNWSPKLSSWVGYHFVRNNYTAFDYNNTPVGRSLESGFTYTIDRMNAITFYQNYDLASNNYYERDITWNRNLHCWQMAITYKNYRDRPHQLVWELSLAKF